MKLDREERFERVTREIADHGAEVRKLINEEGETREEGQSSIIDVLKETLERVKQEIEQEKEIRK